MITYDLTQDPSIDSSFCRRFLSLIISILVSQPLLLNYTRNTCSLNSARSLNLAWQRGLVHNLQIKEQGSTIQERLQASQPLQPYFKSSKGISRTSLRRGILTRFAVKIFILRVAQHEKTKKITTDELLTRTTFQCFLNQAPRLSFKKLIVSTPSLLQGLHTMSLLKSIPEGLKPRECKPTKLHEPPPVPYVPTKDEVQEEVAKLRNLKLRPPLRKIPPSTFRCGTRTGLVKPSLCT
jgi:hypothetical protein